MQPSTDAPPVTPRAKLKTYLEVWHLVNEEIAKKPHRRLAQHLGETRTILVTLMTKALAEHVVGEAE